MVPLQSDFDHGTQSHILTCYMFPQQPPADEGIYTSWFKSNQTLCLTHYITIDLLLTVIYGCLVKLASS